MSFEILSESVEWNYYRLSCNPMTKWRERYIRNKFRKEFMKHGGVGDELKERFV